jgi:hypothetical protein
MEEGDLGIAILVVLFVLSVVYLFIQPQHNRNARALGDVGGGTRGTIPTATESRGPQRQSVEPVSTISTTNLTETQLRLHRSLIMRNGTRSITICMDAILEDACIGLRKWKDEATMQTLVDLVHVADVYILCMIPSADEALMESIRGFIMAAPGIRYDKSTEKGLKEYKIIFCTTKVGRIAFVRQIEPLIHIEGKKQVFV